MDQYNDPNHMFCNYKLISKIFERNVKSLGHFFKQSYIISEDMVLGKQQSSAFNMSELVDVSKLCYHITHDTITNALYKISILVLPFRITMARCNQTLEIASYFWH